MWNGGYCIGMTDLAGNTRWASEPAAMGYPVRARGRWWLASTCQDTLRWMDPADGRVCASLTLPSSAGPAAVADVDGDGDEELVVACQEHLVAARLQGESAVQLWQVQAPAPILNFVLADTDGDGLLEAVLLCGDGFLYGVDEPAARP